MKRARQRNDDNHVEENLIAGTRAWLLSYMAFLTLILFRPIDGSASQGARQV